MLFFLPPLLHRQQKACGCQPLPLTRTFHSIRSAPPPPAPENKIIFSAVYPCGPLKLLPLPGNGSLRCLFPSALLSGVRLSSHGFAIKLLSSALFSTVHSVNGFEGSTRITGQDRSQKTLKNLFLSVFLYVLFFFFPFLVFIFFCHLFHFLFLFFVIFIFIQGFGKNLGSLYIDH